MKHLDYLIVGCGLAGIAFCEQLRKHNKSFVVYDNASQQSSKIAAGLYNPVVLKRFSKVWKSKEQLQLLDPYYKELENLLKNTLDYKFSIFRKFSAIEEQNLWFQASDNPNLEPYLSTALVTNSNANVNADYGFGEVLKAGRIETKILVEHYKAYLRKQNLLKEDTFKYSSLEIKQDKFYQDSISSNHIIFAEGFGLKENPYFNYLPLNGTKGEVLTIKAPDLKLKNPIKSSVFVIPTGDDFYKVGATYNRDDKTNLPTNAGKNELIKKLKSLVNCDFSVVEQNAGVRPTVKDRRPLVGRHTKFKNMYILNGLGSRGVMISPYTAEQLYKYIEQDIALDPEIDISRFNL